MIPAFVSAFVKGVFLDARNEAYSQTDHLLGNKCYGEPCADSEGCLAGLPKQVCHRGNYIYIYIGPSIADKSEGYKKIFFEIKKKNDAWKL